MSLLRVIEHHLRATGMSASRFGRAVANDPGLVHEMRRGREPRPKLERRIRAFVDVDGGAAR